MPGSDSRRRYSFARKRSTCGAVVVRHDLRQEELAAEVLVAEKPRLRRRDRRADCPAAERQVGHVLADRLAQLPRVLHASRRADRPIAAEHDERAEALLPGALGIGQAELERVLRREERHDAIARHVGAEIDDQVAQVVFFARADGAVGEEHERPAAHEAADRVIRVDPRVHAGRRVELRARRPQLDRQPREPSARSACTSGDVRHPWQYRQWGGMMPSMATALATLMSLPAVPLAPHATPVDELTRLAAALGAASPRLFIKRDDLLSFGCGGNKVRKMQTVVAEARAAGADTLITCGGVQSNHARVTAAAGAALGL